VGTSRVAFDSFCAAAQKGIEYITPSVAEKMVAYIEVDLKRPLHELLSDRELQVLVLGGGKSVGDIAGELSLSVKPTAQLIKYAVQYDLVQ